MASDQELPLEQAWQNWIMCLKGDDENSIFNQITLMLWDTAIFRIIRESQIEKFNKNPQAPRINHQLFSFIYRNYFHSQSAYIRRITDPNSSLTGKYGTYSLGAIIKDLINYREELSREKYLELRGFPYDYLEIQAKETAFILNHHPGKAIPIPDELDWWKIKDAHETFDRLSHTNLENRKSSDLIDENLLVSLQEKLEDSRKINLYVNKFIAHAATLESRSNFNIDEYSLSLNDIWDTHRIIFKISNFLSAILFSIDNMPLAIEHPTFFYFWDEPFFAKEEAFEKVRSILESYREETEAWMVTSTEDVWSWFGIDNSN